MERDNHLSDNLKAYQRARDETLTEFSSYLGIARSTLRSVMVDGNTTVDTLVRIANALGVTLNELVFGRVPPAWMDRLQGLVSTMGWYVQLPAYKQGLLLYHLSGICLLMGEEETCEPARND